MVNRQEEQANKTVACPREVFYVVVAVAARLLMTMVMVIRGSRLHSASKRLE